MYKWILFIVWSNNQILEDWESFNTGEKTKWQDHKFWKRALLSNHYHNFTAQPGWINYISECSEDNSKEMDLLLTVSCSSWTEQWTSIVQHPGISPSSNSFTGKTLPKSEQSILFPEGRVTFPIKKALLKIKIHQELLFSSISSSLNRIPLDLGDQW